MKSRLWKQILIGVFVASSIAAAGPAPGRLSDEQVRRAAEARWQEFREQNGVPEAIALEIKVIYPHREPGKPEGYDVRFEQTFHGVPLAGSAAGRMFLTADGEFDRWASDWLYTNDLDIDPNPGISSKRATRIAIDAVGEQDATISSVKLGAFPADWPLAPDTRLDHDMLLWSVAVIGSQTHGFYIDAHSGKILLEVKPSSCK